MSANGAGDVEAISPAVEVGDHEGGVARVAGEEGLKEGPLSFDAVFFVVGGVFGDGESCDFGEDAEVPFSSCALVFFGGVEVGAELLPETSDGGVVVGGVGGEGAFFVIFAGDGVFGVCFFIEFCFPVADFEARDAELEEMRTDVVRDGAEVFTNDFVFSSGL